MTTEWYGMPEDQIEARSAEVPAPPDAVTVERGQMHTQGHKRKYARVHFSGSHGHLCGEYQEFDMTNVDEDTVRRIAWSAFGLCDHTTTYYDEDGNEIDR